MGLERMDPDSEPSEPSVVTIEIAKPEDAEAIRKIHAASWLDTYPNEELGITTEDVRKRLEKENKELIAAKVDPWRIFIETAGENHAVFIAKVDGQPVGFTSPLIEKSGRHRVGAIYLVPEAQGRGIGTRLMKQNLAWHGANDVYLTVVTYNEKAIRLYRKLGFEKTGRELSQEELVDFGNGKIMPEIEMIRRYKA